MFSDAPLTPVFRFLAEEAGLWRRRRGWGGRGR